MLNQQKIIELLTKAETEYTILLTLKPSKYNIFAWQSWYESGSSNLFDELKIKIKLLKEILEINE